VRPTSSSWPTHAAPVDDAVRYEYLIRNSPRTSRVLRTLNRTSRQHTSALKVQKHCPCSSLIVRAFAVVLVNINQTKHSRTSRRRWYRWRLTLLINVLQETVKTSDNVILSALSLLTQPVPVICSCVNVFKNYFFLSFYSLFLYIFYQLFQILPRISIRFTLHMQACVPIYVCMCYLFGVMINNICSCKKTVHSRAYMYRMYLSRMCNNNIYSPIWGNRE